MSSVNCTMYKYVHQNTHTTPMSINLVSLMNLVPIDTLRFESFNKFVWLRQNDKVKGIL